MIDDHAGSPRWSVTAPIIAATGPSRRTCGSTRTLGKFRCGRASKSKKSPSTPCGSSRSSSGEPVGPNDGSRPCAHDGGSQRHRWLLDRERHQQAQARALAGYVADHGEPHFAVLEAWHGGRQETRIEEDVGFQRARAEKFQFLNQIETGGCRINAEAAGWLRAGPLRCEGTTSRAGVARRDPKSSRRRCRRSFPRREAGQPSA